MKINRIGMFLVYMLPLLALAQQNVVKFYPGPILSTRNLRFGYERTFGDRLSVAADVGYIMPRNFFTGLSGQLDDSTGVTTYIEETLKAQGFNVMAQLRFYPGDEAPKGFFVAPYLRHSRLSGSIKNTALADSLTGSLKMGVYGTAGGLMLGYQFMIGDQITIDWQILGIGLTQYAFQLRAEVESQSAEFNEYVDDLNSVIEDYNSIPFFPSIPISTDISNGVYEVKPKVFTPSVRSNIGVGFVF